MRHLAEGAEPELQLLNFRSLDRLGTRNILERLRLIKHASAENSRPTWPGYPDDRKVTGSETELGPYSEQTTAAGSYTRQYSAGARGWKSGLLRLFSDFLILGGTVFLLLYPLYRAVLTWAPIRVTARYRPLEIETEQLKLRS